MSRKTDNGKRRKGSGVTSTGTRLRVVEGNAGRSNRYRSGSRRGGPEKPEYEGGGKGLKVLAVLAFLCLLLGGAAWYLLSHYHVENVYVEGNVHYTSEEIIEMVTSQRFGDNSLFLSLKYKDRGIQGIPFIERMDVQVAAPDTIRIIVYEKSVAGYVEYLDRYMYFDKDGIIVEASGTKTAGIPEITGISFSQVVLYEPLPVENQEIFQDILSITQMLSKYDLNADKIYFDDSYQMTLYFADVRARLGSEDNLEEKVARLQQILPAAEGKKGVFRLENYSGTGSNVSFELDQ